MICSFLSWLFSPQKLLICHLLSLFLWYFLIPHLSCSRDEAYNPLGSISILGMSLCSKETGWSSVLLSLQFLGYNPAPSLHYQASHPITPIGKTVTVKCRVLFNVTTLGGTNKGPGNSYPHPQTSFEALTWMVKSKPGGMCKRCGFIYHWPIVQVLVCPARWSEKLLKLCDMSFWKTGSSSGWHQVSIFPFPQQENLGEIGVHCFKSLVAKGH